jgi:hypothetical protein
MIRGQDETRAGSSGSEWSGWPRSADAGGLMWCRACSRRRRCLLLAD